MNKVLQFVFVYLILVLCVFVYAKRIDSINKRTAENLDKPSYYESSLVKNY